MATRADVRRLAGSRLRNTVTGSIAGYGYKGQGVLSRREASVLGMFMDAPSAPLPRVATESDALGLPTFGRAVALICNAIAGTDWYARRRRGELYERLEDQPSIVTNTDPLSTIWNYRWAVAEDGILYGNHFALLGDLDYRTGRPGWTVPLPADSVWIMTDAGRPGWWQWVIGGNTFAPDDLFHVPFGAKSGRVLGRGVLEQYSEWMGGSVAAEEYSRDQFAAGALPPAVITTNQATTPTQATELKDRWREIVSSREPVIFPNGTEVKPVVGNAQQAQLVEARQWNAEMVAHIVGVPNWKLGLPGPSMTYQNVETGDIDFIRDSVDRFARPLTEAMSKWLLPAGTEMAWDYDSRMRADQKTTAEVLDTYVSSSILTKDEARAKLNRPPLERQDAPPADEDQQGATTNTGTAADAGEARTEAGTVQMGGPLS